MVLHTVKVVGKMDKIFDSLNSKSRFSVKKYACAVTNTADDEVKHFLSFYFFKNESKTLNKKRRC